MTQNRLTKLNKSAIVFFVAFGLMACIVPIVRALFNHKLIPLSLLLIIMIIAGVSISTKYFRESCRVNKKIDTVLFNCEYIGLNCCFIVLPLLVFSICNVNSGSYSVYMPLLLVYSALLVTPCIHVFLTKSMRFIFNASNNFYTPQGVEYSMYIIWLVMSLYEIIVHNSPNDSPHKDVPLAYITLFFIYNYLIKNYKATVGRYVREARRNNNK